MDEGEFGRFEGAGEFGGAAAGVGEQAVGGLVLGHEAGGGLGARGEGGLDGDERLRGGLGDGAGFVEGVGVTVMLGGEGGAFLGEAGGGRLGVAVERSLAFAVGDELGALGLERGDVAAGGGEVAVEAVAFQRQALQQRAGDGVLVAQGGQALLGGGAEAGGLGGGGLRLAGGAGRLGEGGGGGGAAGLGVVPQPPDQQSLGAAQRLGDLAVALGLARLAGEAGELGVEGLEHVGDAGEVGLGGAELELGLVAALVEAGDAGGLLEDAAAGLGPGVDQLGDLALANQRRGLRAGRGVGEEHRDVARARLLAGDLVGRTRVAGDAADDGEVVLVVEAGRARGGRGCRR